VGNISLQGLDFVYKDHSRWVFEAFEAWFHISYVLMYKQTITFVLVHWCYTNTIIV